MKFYDRRIGVITELGTGACKELISQLILKATCTTVKRSAERADAAVFQVFQWSILS